jgi:hypothetical protein
MAFTSPSSNAQGGSTTTSSTMHFVKYSSLSCTRRLRTAADQQTPMAPVFPEIKFLPHGFSHDKRLTNDTFALGLLRIGNDIVFLNPLVKTGGQFQKQYQSQHVNQRQSIGSLFYNHSLFSRWREKRRIAAARGLTFPRPCVGTWLLSKEVVPEGAWRRGEISRFGAHGEKITLRGY